MTKLDLPLPVLPQTPTLVPAGTVKLTLFSTIGKSLRYLQQQQQHNVQHNQVAILPDSELFHLQRSRARPTAAAITTGVVTTSSQLQRSRVQPTGTDH
eukprot:12273-Heterococcus_DN1.PRE.2